MKFKNKQKSANFWMQKRQTRHHVSLPPQLVFGFPFYIQMKWQHLN